MFYFIIALFLFYSLTHKEPIKWMKILNVLSLNQYVRREDEPCHIPGPLQLPIIGTKWNLWFMKMNKLHEYYEQLNRKYGNVVMEMQGNIPIVSLFKREDIDTVLKHPSRYPFRPPTEIISFYRKSRPDRYSSVGLVNAQGKEWAHIRAHVVPNALQNRLFLANFSSELCDISDDFIRKVRSQRDSDNVMENVHLALKSMSFECACCLMLGRRFDQIGVENFDELTKAANNIFTCMRDAYYGNGLWKYLPSKTLRTFARSEELLYDTVSKIIAKTLQEDNLENKDVRKSVMYSILNSEGLDDRDKITGIIGKPFECRKLLMEIFRSQKKYSVNCSLLKLILDLPIFNSLFLFHRFHHSRHRAVITLRLFHSLLFNNKSWSSAEDSRGNSRHERSFNARWFLSSALHKSSHPWGF